MRDCRRQPVIDHLSIRNADARTIALITDVDMGRIMIVEEHPHRDSKKIGYRWQSFIRIDSSDDNVETVSFQVRTPSW